MEEDTMKKLSLLLVIVMALSLMLSSCRVVWSVVEPKDEIELYERIDKMMNKQKSYKGDVTAELAFTYMGIEFLGDMTMEIVSSGSPGDDDYYFYSGTRYELKGNGETVSTSDEIVAYEDGIAYVCENEGDDFSRISSELSGTEFYDFYVDSEVDFDVSPEDASERSMKKLEEGGWSLSFSEFDKEELDEMLESFGIADTIGEEMGVKIYDVEVEITIDKKYLVDTMSLSFLGEGYEKPIFFITIEYSEYNKAEKVELDKSIYTETYDVRLARQLESFYSDALKEERFRFDLLIEHRVTVDIRGDEQTKVSSERDNVKIENKEDLFFYTVVSNSSGEQIVIDYAYGLQTATLPGSEAQKRTQSELEAISFISSLLNPADFGPEMVRDISKIGKGIYRIELEISDYTQYRQIMHDADLTFKEATLFLEVEMDGDDVKRIASFATVKGEKSYVKCTYIIENKVTVLED